METNRHLNGHQFIVRKVAEDGISAFRSLAFLLEDDETEETNMKRSQGVSS